jgi:hypothetical protein
MKASKPTTKKQRTSKPTRTQQEKKLNTATKNKIMRLVRSSTPPKNLTHPKGKLEVDAWAELDTVWTKEFTMSYREVLEQEADQQRRALRRIVKRQMNMCKVLFNDLDTMMASI